MLMFLELIEHANSRDAELPVLGRESFVKFWRRLCELT